MSKRSLLDKYYSDKELADEATKQIVKENPHALIFIDTSGGKGSHLKALRKYCKTRQRSIAFDIAPEDPGIIKCDFFKVTWEDYNLSDRAKIVFIVSPPFGNNNSLAVKFFNEAAKRGNTIYFICSRIFKKPYNHRYLDKHFRLKWSRDLPNDYFTLNGEKCELRCCIQKWVWKKTKRKKSRLKYKSDFFDFRKRKEGYDFAICRVNKMAGKVITNYWEYKQEKNAFYIKFRKEYKHLLGYIKNNIDLHEEANNTIIANSVTKYEIVAEIDRLIKIGLLKL